MKIHYLTNGWQMWYDIYVRVWYAARFDVEGNQLCDVLDSYDRPGIESQIASANTELLPSSRSI